MQNNALYSLRLYLWLIMICELDSLNHIFIFNFPENDAYRIIHFTPQKTSIFEFPKLEKINSQLSEID